MKKINLILIILLYANIVFSQEKENVYNYYENEKELVFYLKNNPAIAAFTLPKQKPVLSVSKIKLANKKQKLGSLKLIWKSTKNIDYYYKNYKAEENLLVLKSKNDTINISLVNYENKDMEYVTQFNYVISQKIITKKKYHYFKITWHIPLFENEDVYGGGEQFSFANVKGKKIPFIVEEQGIGRGDQPISSITRLAGASGDKTSTFMPIANFVTSGKRTICTGDNTFSFQSIDFSKNNYAHWSQYLNEQESNSTIFIKLPKKNTWNLVKNFEPQPAFMFKTILGLQGGTDTVLQKLKILKDAGLKPSALWIQDWCGRRVTPFGKQLYWNWQLDTMRYTNFKKFRNDLQAQDIKLLGYINPFLAEGTPLAAQCIAQDSFKSIEQSSILLRNKKLKPYLMKVTGFKAHLFDLLGTSSFIFLEDIMKKELIDNGFSGWMADFGEWYPLLGLSRTALENESIHNIYPNKWAELQSMIKSINIEDNKDTLGIFMRSSTTPSGNIYWAGDQNTNWGKNDGLPSLVPALLSSGLSGIGINHGDIGGFTSFKKTGFAILRDRELLYRWIELCAFTPVFRTHEGLAPDYNLQVYSDADAAGFFAKFSAIHDSLHSYIMTTYHEIETTHLPMVRHLVIKYPDDLNVRNLDYQFMLGNTILVIPVLKKGATTVRGYLPAGLWQHFFTKEIIESKGEWRVFDAPIGKPCVWNLLVPIEK